MLQGDPNYPSPPAIWLREKIPGPLLIISIIGIPLILYGGLGSLLVGRYDLSAIVFLCGGLPWLFLYTNEHRPEARVG